MGCSQGSAAQTTGSQAPRQQGTSASSAPAVGILPEAAEGPESPQHPLSCRLAAGTNHSLLLLAQRQQPLSFGLDGAELKRGVSPAGSGAKQVAVGWHHTLAVTQDGEVLGFRHVDFKRHDEGQLRMPSKKELKGRKVLQAAAGHSHSILLLETGEVLAFGNNKYRQCEVPSWAPGARAVEVAAGHRHSLVLLNTGEFLAFGSTEYGQTKVPKYDTAQLARELAAAAQPQHQVPLKAAHSAAAAASTPQAQAAPAAAPEVATDALPSHSSAAAAASTLPGTPQVALPSKAAHSAAASPPQAAPEVVTDALPSKAAAASTPPAQAAQPLLQRRLEAPVEADSHQERTPHRS